MRLTTITTCNNYNNVYLRIPKICNLKFINLTITRKSLPKLVSLYALPLATQQYIKGAAFPDARLLGPNNINNTYSNLE